MKVSAKSISAFSSYSDITNAQQQEQEEEEKQQQQQQDARLLELRRS